MRLHIAWQKVTNKNSNELLREFFQKGQHLFNVLPSLSLSTITPVPEIKQKKNPTVIGFVFFSCGGDEGVRSKQRLRNSEVSEFTRINDRLRSTICCKQQCYAFVRQIAQSLAMSAALDFRKCKRLLLSSLAVSPKGFTPQAARHRRAEPPKRKRTRQ
jgi:hypothetical protein